MAFRFRKSIKVLPGIRVNIGKRGVSSISVGKRGASFNISGTGVGYSTSARPNPRPEVQHGLAPPARAPARRWPLVLTVIALASLAVGLSSAVQSCLTVMQAEPRKPERTDPPSAPDAEASIPVVDVHTLPIAPPQRTKVRSRTPRDARAPNERGP